MKKNRMYAVCLLVAAAVLFSTGCATTPAQPVGSAKKIKPVQTTVASVDKYGNAALAVSADDITAAGFAAGDIVHIRVNTFTADAPVGTNYSDVDHGKYLVRVAKGTVQIAINMGNFAKASGAAESTPVTISLVKKGGYLTEYSIRQLKKSENRSDYASDVIFANFRAVQAGTVAPGRLYRSCNPVYTDARAPYAAALVEQSGIKTVINLADSTGSAAPQLASAPYYQNLSDNGNVIYLDMGVDFTDPAFTAKLHDGLIFLSTHAAGPYLIHCNEGKDRAGYVAAVLEALCGASVSQITDDYMISYENYYGVKKGTEQYSTISRTIPDMFAKLNGGKPVTDKTIGAVTVQYLQTTVGLSADQVAAVRKNLQ
jgi:hypothetical protein